MAILRKRKTEDATPAPAGKARAPKASKAKEATPVVEKKPAQASGRSLSVLATRTILAPVATEKAAYLAEKGVYAFLVAPSANQIAVRQAFRELYRVTPVKVNIIRVRGTAKRFGRFVGKTSDIKKALITLPQGVRINVFESV